jgi:hypothetical protein
VDLRKTALTEEPIPLPPASGEGTEAVRLVQYEPAEIELDVRAHGTALLVASETEYPGWQAWVDGRETPIHRVDVAMRGVVVPDGQHRVRMEFRPGILWVGLATTLVTGALLLALAAWPMHAGSKAGMAG